MKVLPRRRVSTSHSLLAAHISSLCHPSQTHSVRIDTIQRDLPFSGPSSSSSPSPENNLPQHASHAAYYQAREQPSLLLRVVNNNYSIHLSSATNHVPPIELTFPSPILPNPTLVPDQYSETHLIVCTKAGSVYRLVLPVSSLWCDAGRLDVREYVVKSAQSGQLASTYVVNPGEMLIALKDGAVLKLKASRSQKRPEFQDWVETKMSISTGLGFAISLFGPRLPGSSDIISFGSIPTPAPTELVFTLSRDRQLRVWRDRCVGTIQLGTTFDGTRKGSYPKATSLLPPTQSTYIRVLPALRAPSGKVLDDDMLRRVLVFIPTPTEDIGGFFTIYELGGWTNAGLRAIKQSFVLEGSEASKGSELRDFVVIDERIWCLWDHHGQALAESLYISENEEERGDWVPVPFPTEADYSPAYFDDLLLGTGSMTDIFMSAILRPGVFSRLTLETALMQYRVSILSETNVMAGHYPALVTSYPTLSEHIAGIVGCTVDCAVDLQTGEKLWDQYWGALKRDWEGFVARCREIERSARWPLALGVGEGGRLIVMERERLGTVVVDDDALYALKAVSSGVPPPAPSHVATVFDIANTLRYNLDTKPRMDLDNAFAAAGKELMAFSFREVGLDIVIKHLDPFIDVNVASFIVDRTSAIDGFEGVVREALEVICGLEPIVKGEMMEEDDPFVARSHSNSSTTLALPTQDKWEAAQWPKLFTAAYIASSVAARYELCLSLMVLAVFVAGETPEKMTSEPSVLDQVFEAFKSLSVLKTLCETPAGHLDARPSAHSPAERTGEDEIADKLQGMRVASVGAPSGPSSFATVKVTDSIMHALVSSAPSSFDILECAHRYLRANALLVPSRDRDPQVAEVRLMEDLRCQGFLQAVLDVGAWVSEGPGAAYVMARTLLDMGKVEQAVGLFEVISGAGNFGDERLEKCAGDDALEEVLPYDDKGLSAYYDHLATLFESRSLDEYVVKFAKLAIGYNLETRSTEYLWEKVFRGYVALQLYEEAYMAMASTPDSSLRDELVRQLVTILCDRGELDLLTRLNFVGFQTEVENTLAFRARHSDPMRWPDYSKALYSWHAFHGDYRSAGAAMYLKAQRLSEFPVRPEQYIDLATMQAHCYLTAINALALVERQNAWVALPASLPPQSDGDKADGFKESSTDKWLRKRRKTLSSFVPDDRFTTDAGNEVAVVELADIRREYELVMSRLALADRYPEHDMGRFMVGPLDIVSRYVQNGAYDDAMGAARSLDVPMTMIFENLTSRCMQLSRIRGDQVEDFSSWALFDRLKSSEGTPVTQAWRYLQESLERNDSADTDFEYRKVVLKKILDEDRTSRLPAWLVQFFELRQPEHLIRMCLKYDLLEEALRHSLNLVKQVQRRSRGSDSASREPFKTAAAAWMPYTVFDQLLLLTQSSTTKGVIASRAELLKELEAWKLRARKLGDEIRSRR